MTELEAEILEHLKGQPPQMVSEVARAMKIPARETRTALHNLVDTGDAWMSTTRNGAEVFEAGHGGYSPGGRAA